MANIVITPELLLDLLFPDQREKGLVLTGAQFLEVQQVVILSLEGPAIPEGAKNVTCVHRVVDTPLL